MSEVYDFHVDGHELVAEALNPPDAPGHPVILLHGISGSIRFWGAYQIQAFLEQGPCYALSLPGHHPAVIDTDGP